MSDYPWLLLAVYVVTVGVIQLLALWAATSARPWLLRALVVWGAIMLLLPIRVMEPAAMLTMSAVWTMGISLAIVRFSAPREDSGNRRRLLRFGLADLLVLMLFLGTWLALVDRWLPKDYQLWYSAVVAMGTLPLALITIFAYRAVVGPQRMLMGMLALGVIWISALLLRAQNVPLNLGEGQPSVGWWFPYEDAHSAAAQGALPLVLAVCLSVAVIAWRALRTTPVATPRRRCLLAAIGLALAIGIPTAWLIWDEFSMTPIERVLIRIADVGIHSILLIALAGFIALITWLASASWNKTPDWTRCVARAVSFVLALTISLPAAWIYWQLLWYTPFPRLNDGRLGHYERILAIAKRQTEFQTVPQPIPPALRAELDEAVVLLRETNDVPRQIVEPGLSSSRVVVTGFEPVDIFNLSRRFREAAEQAGNRGDSDRVADYSAAIIRFDAMIDRGGSSNNAHLGYFFLIKHRGSLSPAKAGETVALLDRTLGERYPAQTVVAWNRALWERQGSWYRKLKLILGRLPFDPAREDHVERIRKSRMTWETVNRVLQADLAIRVYRSEHGRLPASLVELSPEILSELPIDPYSGKPLIYRPNEPTFELYSVGPDGVDDGGKSPHWFPDPDAKEIDLGLQ